MSCFAQTTAGDLDISSGNLRVVSDLATVTATKLSNLFGLFKGEWFADAREGMPYFQYVFIQNPDLGVCGSIFRQAIMSAPGVDNVISANIDFISNLRQMRAVFTIRLLNGAVLEGGPGVPFVIIRPSGATT